jgi:hypothetical protein
MLIVGVGVGLLQYSLASHVHSPHNNVLYNMYTCPAKCAAYFAEYLAYRALLLSFLLTRCTDFGAPLQH